MLRCNMLTQVVDIFPTVRGGMELFQKEDCSVVASGAKDEPINATARAKESGYMAGVQSRPGFEGGTASWEV
jgi:hypothetical protein